MERKQKRIDWIDISKAIAIIMMILGHTPIPESIKVIFYSFHMPIFSCYQDIHSILNT